jgi:pimeloyl-ACP methyl ester carboxylesterase
MLCGIESGIFLPGYLGRARSYEPGLPEGWIAVQAPLEIRASGSLGTYRDWLVAHVRAAPGEVTLGGHSMGAALAVLAAAEVPERVAGLVLVGPAGLPLAKPVRRIVKDFLAQLLAGRFRARDVLLPLADVARAPQSALWVARALRRLDISAELRTVRDAGVPAAVIACATDTLTTPASSRRVAELLGARYRELRLEGGHVWMFGRWNLLAEELRAAGYEASTTRS